MFSIIYLIHLVKNRYCLTKKTPDQLKLPNWVNVSKERFNVILSIITKAKKRWVKN